MPLTDLHEPILPILRRVLAGLPIRPSGRVLDLACGDTAKWPLYQSAWNADIALIGLDWDRQALAQGPTHAQARSVVGAAQSLPFRPQAFDGALCIAAMGLFVDVQQVLAELQRVLRPGAPVLFVTAERRWAEVLHWPPALATRLAAAAMHTSLPLAHADLTGDLEMLIQRAGFGQLASRAFLLEQQLPGAATELALLPWAIVRPHLAAQLSAGDLASCDQLEPEIELCSVALACVAYSGIVA